MLLRQTSIDEIRLGLAVLQGYIRPGGPLNLTDINIHAEDFVGEVLNLLYDWNLINTNSVKANYPCIDLLDKNKYIGVQVTTEQGVKKVNKTYSCCTNELVGTITQLYVFSLIPKQNSYALKNIGGTISFSKNEILDFDDVLRKVKGSSDEKVIEVHKYIANQMPAVFANSRSKKQALRQEIASCLNMLNREVLKAPERFEQPMQMIEAIKEIRIDLQKVGASRIASETVAAEFQKITEELRQCYYKIMDEFPCFADFPRGTNPPYNQFKAGDYERSIQRMMEIRHPINASIAAIEVELKAIDTALA
ncbi:MAG: SMEK domain-containing protein [Gammaproteobacteria bacterium]|nr:SMEK domain-containing protein [Gammaproteobacteria bacterium]MBU1601800.1 SMEK domain-containing protein [Gammaproteobacteria bacterium]MBU2432172.1 SMEK domain-containing protein [Gammaproteobacteria bacterium]MBU2450435.1 SMEK domain-containing protein [Gammaproteobacteria bacterium]